MPKHPREKLTPLALKKAGPGRHADGEGLYCWSTRPAADAGCSGR